MADHQNFTVKDSGVRQEYPSGMRRDTQEDKVNYRLIPVWFLKRLAEHLTKGAKKYGKHNWALANSMEELERFEESGERHFMQWLNKEVDEDHAMATVFNIMAAEHVKDQINPKPSNFFLEEFARVMNESLADDGNDFCTVFWETGSHQVMTYREMYRLNPMISNQIKYFVDGALTFHTLPGKNE